MTCASFPSIVRLQFSFAPSEFSLRLNYPLSNPDLMINYYCLLHTMEFMLVVTKDSAFAGNIVEYNVSRFAFMPVFIAKRGWLADLSLPLRFPLCSCAYGSQVRDVSLEQHIR